MERVPLHVLVSLLARVVRTPSGQFVLSHDSLQSLSKEIGTGESTSGSFRFSRWISRTASKFLAQNTKDVVVETGTLEGHWYDANVFALLLFDLVGLEIPIQELRTFLNNNQSCVVQPIEINHSDTAGFEIYQEVDFEFGSSDKHLLGRKARTALRREIFEQFDQSGQLTADPSVVDHFHDSQQQSSAPTQSESSCRSSTFSVHHFQEMFDMISQKDKKIQELTYEKKRLQQQLRRTEDKLKKQRCAHEKTCRDLQFRHDFDPHRRDENWEGRKNWSWLTPVGQANLAVAGPTTRKHVLSMIQQRNYKGWFAVCFSLQRNHKCVFSVNVWERGSWWVRFVLFWNRSPIGTTQSQQH